MANSKFKPLYQEFKTLTPFRISSVRFMITCDVAWKLQWSVDGDWDTDFTHNIWGGSDNPVVFDAGSCIPVNNAPLNCMFRVIPADSVTVGTVKITQ